MQYRLDSSFTRMAGLNKQLRLLASVEAGTTDVLSGYFDARVGLTACLLSLRREAVALRKALHEVARRDFDELLDLAERQLSKAWSDDAQGMALFVRNPAGGPIARTLKFAIPFDDLVRYYRVPVLDPLLALAEIERPFILALARQNSVQVIDVDTGTTRAKVWARLGGAVASASPGRWGRKRIIASLDRPLQRVKRVLVGSTPAPLVLAGDPAALRDLRIWLPSRVTKRLIDVMVVPSSLSQLEAIDFVRARMADLARIDSAETAAHLVQALRIPGRAVAGRLASLKALRSGKVETLVIAKDQPAEPGWVCRRCDNGGFFAARPGSCPACGSHTLAVWDPVVELSRMACRQGARVVIADSDELRYLGGVGCLLRQPGGFNVMPLPMAYRELDLVA